MDLTRLRAFIIGPIGDRDADEGSPARIAYEDAIETLEHVIRPACAAVDVDAVRADEIAIAGEINEQVFRLLRDAAIVIADLTGANPNVMYELGLRHTTGKLTFQIGEKGRLPFDVSTIRTILFKRTEGGLISAKRLLIAAMAESISRGADPVPATRIWLEKPGTDLSVTSASGPIDDSEPAGFLEHLAEMELGLADISQTSERATSILAEITQVMDEGAAKINKIPAVANYSALKLAAVNQIANSLEGPADRLNIAAREFQDNVERVVPGIEYLLSEAAKDPRQLKEAPDFLDQMYGLFAVSTEAAANAELFAHSLDQAADATRLMRRVTESIRRSTLSMVTTFRSVAAWQTLADKIGA